MKLGKHQTLVYYTGGSGESPPHTRAIRRLLRRQFQTEKKNKKNSGVRCILFLFAFEGQAFIIGEDLSSSCL